MRGTVVVERVRQARGIVRQRTSSPRRRRPRSSASYRECSPPARRWYRDKSRGFQIPGPGHDAALRAVLGHIAVIAVLRVVHSRTDCDSPRDNTSRRHGRSRRVVGCSTSVPCVRVVTMSMLAVCLRECGCRVPLTAGEQLRILRADVECAVAGIAERTLAVGGGMRLSFWFISPHARGQREPRRSSAAGGWPSRAGCDSCCSAPSTSGPG